MLGIAHRSFLLVLALLCAATFGCVSVQSPDEVRAELDRLSGQIEALQESQRALDQRIDRLDQLAARRVATERPAAGPDPEEKQLVTIGDAPTKGPESAPVKIVGWFDFQCPYCRKVGPTLEQIRYQYGDRVQLAFKHLPLPMHSKARGAHVAAEAAHLQGRFWEMHDKIFSNPRSMSPGQYLSYARQLGLDIERFKRDVESPQVKSRIEEDMRQADRLGVRGTPAFFVNGRFLSGAQPFAAFKQLIDEELTAAAGQ